MMKDCKNSRGEWNMRSKKVLMLCLCVILMLGVCLIAGCKGANTNAEELNSYDLKLYYVNDEYVATGNEELDQMMNPYEVTIQSKPEEAYLQAVLELKEVPLDGYDTMLREEFVIHSIKTDEGIAVVDFSSKDLSGGSMEEGLLVNQIVLTLLNSFDDIQKVQFTLDGEEAESLMGHLDVSKPFTLSNTEGENKAVVIAE